MVIWYRNGKCLECRWSNYDNDAALKIADSEFARSLQPRGLAETLWFLTVYGSRDYAALK
ncbi:unnamed protein product, partial [Brassica oleracea]